MTSWRTLLSTLGLVFVAELGDKTQLAVVTQTCKHRNPWPVFLGASLALTLVTAIGVAGGQLLSNLIPRGVIDPVAALAFIAVGVFTWRESNQSDSDRCVTRTKEDQGQIWSWEAFSSTFGLLLLAELGDKTQLAVVGLTCKRASSWAVFAGSALALIAVTALGVIGGKKLCKLMPRALLLKISAVIFIAMGGLMVTGVL